MPSIIYLQLYTLKNELWARLFALVGAPESRASYFFYSHITSIRKAIQVLFQNTCPSILILWYRGDCKISSQWVWFATFSDWDIGIGDWQLWKHIQITKSPEWSIIPIWSTLRILHYMWETLLAGEIHQLLSSCSR